MTLHSQSIHLHHGHECCGGGHGCSDASRAQDGGVRPVAIILAAGKGTRMGAVGEGLPKVMVPTQGRPMVEWVVRACRDAGISRIILVVGHLAEIVIDAFAHQADVECVLQQPQLGTGHAVDQARPILERLGSETPVVILGGDGPLIRAATIRELLHQHRERRASATLATSVIPDATGYGRIVRDSRGEFSAIVEHKDATEEQRAIREVNPSYYCFRNGDLLRELARVDNKNASGEYYLVDVVTLLKRGGQTVQVVSAVPPEDVLSINTPEQLAEVESILSRRSTGCGVQCACASHTTATGSHS